MACHVHCTGAGLQPINLQFSAGSAADPGRLPGSVCCQNLLIYAVNWLRSRGQRESGLQGLRRAAGPQA